MGELEWRFEAVFHVFVLPPRSNVKVSVEVLKRSWRQERSEESAKNLESL